MYKNHTAVLYDDSGGGVCFFCLLLKTAVSGTIPFSLLDSVRYKKENRILHLPLE